MLTSDKHNYSSLFNHKRKGPVLFSSLPNSTQSVDKFMDFLPISIAGSTRLKVVGRFPTNSGWPWVVCLYL